MKKWIVLLLLFASLTAYGVALPFTFTSGTTITASEINSNFTTLLNAINIHLITNGFTLNDGEIVIGKTGDDNAAGTITGTTNRITVTNGSNSITLTTPQDTHTGATPTYVDMTLTGDLSVADDSTFTDDIAVTGDSTFTGFISTKRRDESTFSSIAALATTTSFIKLTSTVTALEGAANGVDGKQIKVYNDTGSDVTIFDEASGATAADRFKLEGSGNLTLNDGASIDFIYDSGASRWVPAAGTAGVGSTSGVVIAWQGNFENNCGGDWTLTTPSAFTVFPGDSSCTLTEVIDSNFPTVARAGGGTTRPGISFTVATPALYKVCAQGATTNSATNQSFLQLIETEAGTTVMAEQKTVGCPTADCWAHFHICGYVQATAQAYTFELYGENDGGNISINGGSLADALIFTVEAVAGI